MGLLDSLFPGIADWQARERQKRTMTDYGLALKGVDTMSAGMIGSLLSSPSASAQRQGQSMLDAIYQGRSPEAKLQRQIGEQQLSNARTNQQAQGFQNMLEAIKFRDYQRNLPLQEQAARNQLTIQGQQIRANEAAANPPPMSQAAMDAQIWQQQNGAPIPSGMRPQRRFARDPQGQPVQFVDVQPVEGTKPYTEAETALRTQERMVENLNSFLDTLSTTGTEFRGKDALKLSQLRSRIIADYAALQNLGVLQPGEIKNLSEILPDPTGFTNQFNPWAAENIGAVYEQLLQQQEAKTMDLRQQFWFINPKPLMPGE